MRSRGTSGRDDAIAKQLFSSPNNKPLTPDQLKRRAIHPEESPGCIAVMCFLVLVVGAAVSVPVLLAGGLPAVHNSKLATTIMYYKHCVDTVWDLIGASGHVTFTPPDWLNYDGQRILGKSSHQYHTGSGILGVGNFCESSNLKNFDPPKLLQFWMNTNQ